MNPFDMIMLFDSKKMWNLKSFCTVWQYTDNQEIWKSHSDVRCMIYNIYKKQFDRNPYVYQFEISGYTVDF